MSDLIQRLRASCDVREAALLRNLAAAELERLQARLAVAYASLAEGDKRYAAENARLAARLGEREALLQEVRPMVQSYRRKHEKAFEAASRKLFTELAEKHAETIGKCDRILAALAAGEGK